MCRHRQQVQRWGQMLRNSEHPQPSELCARETQWQQLPDAEISSFIPPPATDRGVAQGRAQGRAAAGALSGEQHRL